jgi:hypothetical protein
MTTEAAGYAVADAKRLWLGQTPPAWGDVVRIVPAEARDAAAMIAAADLDWRVEQYRLEAVVEREYQSARVPVLRHVANVRSDTRAVLGVVGKGYEPLQNAAAFAFCDTITDSGRAHWIGAGATHGGARVHALMRLDREIKIGGAEGEDVLPLLCFRNGHDGGLAVTVSVLPFRLACLNGMLLPVADSYRRPETHASCSTMLATAATRSLQPASSPTRAGRAGCAAPGATSTAGSAASGRGRSRAPGRVISTYAARAAQTSLRTAFRTCSLAPRTRAARSSWSRG